ncbi:MAG: uncharacterized protein KVP18_003543 [Porospora cf. gigantea A]|uniref:uncharacterized protein n=1 Tax=Porospora cf. gigantea A TaxID=2853593 RepID=UPI00355A869B|nr:MAG: hypothetical protein KVP18_003543 [Porospora cf. gigantea A]
MELRDRLSALKAHPGTLRADECVRVPVMRILCESLEQFALDIREHERAVSEFKAMCAAELDLRREHRFRIPPELFQLDDAFRWRPEQHTPINTCERVEPSDETIGWGVELFDDAVRAATFNTPPAIDTPTTAPVKSERVESVQVTTARRLIMTTLQRDSNADVMDVQRRLLEITDIVSTFAQKLDAQQEMGMSSEPFSTWSHSRGPI